MLRVTPIYGSTGHHPHSKSISLPPSCTLIEYGGVKVIVNVGHDESRATTTGGGNQFELPEADVVLLTDSSLQSLGGLPLYFGKDSCIARARRGEAQRERRGGGRSRAVRDGGRNTESMESLIVGGSGGGGGGGEGGSISNSQTTSTNNNKNKKIPLIYATFPTLKMGQMNLYDHHANVGLDGGNPGFTLEDVDALFSSAAITAATATNVSTSNPSNHRGGLAASRGGGGTTTIRNNNNAGSNSSTTVTTGSGSSNTNANDKISNNNTSSTTNNNTNNNTEQPHQYPQVQTLKYAQTIILHHPTTRKPLLGITPHRAGHLIGASFFVLKRLADETEVVIAPVYHHAAEKHLDCSTLFKYGTACDVLVTSCGGPGGLLGSLYSPLPPLYRGAVVVPSTTTDGVVTVVPPPPINQKPKLPPPKVLRDENLLIETILSTLRRSGNVLLPVDPSGRVLELLLILNRHWERHRLSSTYNLCWIGSMARETMEFGRSQLEWMHGDLGQRFDSGRGHPYRLGEVRVFATVGEMEAAGLGGVTMMDDEGVGGGGGVKGDENPTVCLASGATLDCGPARDLLLKWGENVDNSIVLTDSRRCVPRGDVLWRQLEKRRRIARSLSLSRLKQQQQMNSKNKRRVRSASIEIVDTTATKVTVGSKMKPIQTDDDDVNMVGSDTPKLMVIPSSDNDEEQPSSTTIPLPDTSTATINNLNDDISPHSTSTQLLLKWCEAKASGVEMADVIEVDVLVPHRAPLAGEELRAFLAGEETMRLREKARQEEMAMLREVELAKGRLRLTEKEEGGGKVGGGKRGGGGSTMNASAAAGGETSGGNSGTPGRGGSIDGGGAIRPKKKSRFDASLFLKYSKPCHMMFEVREEAVGIGQPDSIAKYGIGESIGRAGEVLEDDYGISVKPERFVDIYPSNYAGGGSGRMGEAGGRGLGFGFGADGRPLLSGAGGMAGSARGDGQGGDGNGTGTMVDAEDEEQALEAADLSEGNGIIRGRNNRPPIKVSTQSRQFEVLAEVAFIPLEGRVDAKNARKSVQALQPRQVVILGGGKPSDFLEDNLHHHSQQQQRRGSVEIIGEAGLLAEAVRSLALGVGRGSILAPTDGETVELSVGHAAYSVRLVDTPYMTREEQQELADSGNEIPSFEPYEAKVGECTVSLLDCVATGKIVAVDGSIVLAHRPSSSTKGVSRRHQNVMVSNGDVLLTDLRIKVIAKSMKADYSAHAGYSQLVVNGKIVVRKDQTSGEINVEGPLCEDFFSVRSLVRSHYEIL